MNADEVRFFLRDRWKELRAMSVEQHWKQLNTIARFAIEQGWKRGNDDGEMEVFLRWTRLKRGI